ncbi:hypothetical protein ACWGJ7_43265, partial [Streptomyces tendae]
MLSAQVATHASVRYGRDVLGREPVGQVSAALPRKGDAPSRKGRGTEMAENCIKLPDGMSGR